MRWEYSDPKKELAEGNNEASYSFPILRNYLEHTFRKIKSENKIICTDDKKFSCFNTGLVTQNSEEILLYLKKTGSPILRRNTFFKLLLRKVILNSLHYFHYHNPNVQIILKGRNYFYLTQGLSLLQMLTILFKIIKYRFPDQLMTACDREVKKHLIGAIDDISKRVKINYKIAIPQFYDNKFQLLPPLYLIDEKKPDLALVVERINDKFYSTKTCLTTGMANNNA